MADARFAKPLDRDLILCAHGPDGAWLDVPPFLIATSPRNGTSGLCEGHDVYLWFNTVLDETTVPDAISILKDGVPVGGTFETTVNLVHFIPDPGQLGQGDYSIVVNDQLTNYRGTPGPSEGAESQFSVLPVCAYWTGVPLTVPSTGTGDFTYELGRFS